MTDSTTALITERARTHGDFTDHATVTQFLKDFFRTFQRKGEDVEVWTLLSVTARESLDMQAHKIGRILAGDPDFRDHWDDIAGYARLEAERCTK